MCLQGAVVIDAPDNVGVSDIKEEEHETYCTFRLGGLASRMRKNYGGTRKLRRSARLGQARSVGSIWLIWFVLFIWFIWFIWLVLFNQKTIQTRQTKQRSSNAGGLFQDPARFSRG
jgi:hypothetical protein